MSAWETPARIGVKFETSEPTFVAKNGWSRKNLKNKVEIEPFLTYIGDQSAFIK